MGVFMAKQAINKIAAKITLIKGSMRRYVQDPPELPVVKCAFTAL